MSKLYERLQMALTSHEERPVEIITKQTLSEVYYIVRGNDVGRAAWHYILVPVNKRADLEAQSIGKMINVIEFGRMIEYRNKQGVVVSASGWGTYPHKMIETWIEEQYNNSTSVDGTIDLTYQEDDIRLCTMQRAIPKQLLGVYCHYHKREQLHYIILTEDSPASLARRAGIKDYDRVIYFNGTNIEHKTYDQYQEYWDAERHFPTEMLVCSPATYYHYKANNKIFHCDLPTVQHLKPVYATSTSESNTDIPVISADEHSFCAVQWENINIIDIVSQSSVFKSPEFTCVNDICFVEIEGRYQKGKIIFIGSYDDCEKSKTVSMMQIHDNPTNSISDYINSKPISVKDIVDVPTTLEQLPNELFFYLFPCLEVHHAYNAFWGLNARLNSLFQSCQNLSLTFDENTDQLLIKSYAPYITRLIIDTRKYYDFSEFSNLQSLVLCDGNDGHLKQIQPKIFPNLTRLSFLLGSKFTAPSQLINNIFSNQFPFLSQIILGKIDKSMTKSWSISPSLRFVSIHCNNPRIVEDILITCPNLDHLQLHIFAKNPDDTITVPSFSYSLRRLTLWSHSLALNLDDIEAYLSYTPDFQHLYLQTEYEMSFITLANGLSHRLQHLPRFDCYVKELVKIEDRVDDLSSIHELHPCFNRIKCIRKTNTSRTLATD